MSTADKGYTKPNEPVQAQQHTPARLSPPPGAGLCWRAREPVLPSVIKAMQTPPEHPTPLPQRVAAQ
ncbi:hypothetical protein CKO31_15040 [Thiohalocapsa halophila]|uniref:Uncharacterized protein n=1 Tax=Thiohalocapsa halophila TaxID=69359 RepID=A0ABS1CJC9_9GAMM|nr:hypothetical protein [Thiohalocapsa halophila]MBK1632029.1 hypothetical protein [Thiohalocapsa halophila]